ncbi:MAG: UDP-N-acetylmuramate dehydrogenase [Clostridia bacterium]
MENYQFLVECGCEIALDCKSLSHFGSGGNMRVVCYPLSVDSLAECVRALRLRKEKFVVVGNGTNILFPDSGYDGVAICVRYLCGKRLVGESLIVECGASLPSLCALAEKNSLTGVEGLAEIPASFGGAVARNAGAFGYQICDCLEFVDIFDGEKKRVEKSELKFCYHKSDIPPEWVILGGKLSLQKGNREEIVAKTEKCRQRRALTQPHALTLGSVFSRVGDVSAGFYIDKVGLKGAQIGNVRVSPVHANFFENLGGAKTNEFFALGKLVAQEVDKQLGIELEYEVEFVE